MKNNDLLIVFKSILLDLEVNNTDNAKNTLKTLISSLECNDELNQFKRMIYEKMQFYNTRDKAKNKALYSFYQELKQLPHTEFDFISYYKRYIEIIQ